MALRALAVAASGGRALMDRIDTLANNLANVNTTAYKRTRANFADLLYQQVGDVRFGTGVRLVSTEKIFTQGALQRSERDLDLAVEGEGFLRVRLPDGSLAFTRAGHLGLDAEGNLVAADGRPIDPPLRIPPEISRLLVDPDGRVRGFDARRPEEPRELGRIQLSRFLNPSGLEPAGAHLYRETPAAGLRLDGEPGAEGFGRLRQGFLEGSNVDAVQELVDLIGAQRAFEINAKAIETADQILHAVGTLRR